ncbi:ubiquitin carboxyl-terminal hydrolase 35-like [Thamnophis elegans]|uniref:ubiquitin carboxyl-terminal hydrolase 35-like n=1 Tax=Thamnophis elegans TaxID=35005 RepID=UPI00137700E1|nr:ubiquitin carboxyl-terminal hydrolase 35-like [Thamnophis elegans]
MRKRERVSSREEAFTDLSLAFPPAEDHQVGLISSALIGSGEETAPEISQSRIQTQSKLKDLPARSGILRAPEENPSKHALKEVVGSNFEETSLPLAPERDVVDVKPLKESDLALHKEASGCRASRSVPDLINYFLSPEMLTAENRYHCENCASLQDAEKLTELTEGPHYLILTLLRFSFDLGTMKRKKILDNVSVPLMLKLPVLDFASVVYDLCSVVVHSGVSSESGHYYCYARECKDAAMESLFKDNAWNMAKSTDVEIQWYIFNDTRVFFSSFESVSNVTSFLPKDTAYLLFYRQRARQASHGAGPEPSWTNGNLHSPDKNLMDTIAKDNILFLQEQEKQARNRKAYISALPKSSVWWKDLDRDDHEDDEGASGGCGHDPGGGGSGSFHGLVF